MASMKTVTEVLDLLVRAKPGMDRTMDGFQETVAAWHMVLEPVPDEAVWHAAVLLARSGDAFVNAGQVFQAALDLLDREPPAEKAWTFVEDAVRDARVPQVGIRTELTLQVLPPTRDWGEKDLPHLRRAFEAEYGRLTQAWRRAAAMGEGRLLTDGKE